ncbi:hypothetical protein [Thermococcus nautili]|uniref:hypothetical protein n=1 Tax=Thermococcus nautili TaxID=195522 RepID=UPI0025547D40|nr:hypothetical protein [Thermococcus nautili]
MIAMERIEALLVVVGLLALSVLGYAMTYNSQPRAQPIPPGFGNFNAKLIHLNATSVHLKVGQPFTVKGELAGGHYRINGEEYPYYGRVSLIVYGGPARDSPQWIALEPHLTAPEGIAVSILPKEFYLQPNGEENISVSITPRKSGTFHLYVVAVSDQGWRAWVELNVTAG